MHYYTNFPYYTTLFHSICIQTIMTKALIKLLETKRTNEQTNNFIYIVFLSISYKWNWYY
jgi:hypothetical protein